MIASNSESSSTLRESISAAGPPFFIVLWRVLFIFLFLFLRNMGNKGGGEGENVRLGIRQIGPFRKWRRMGLLYPWQTFLISLLPFRVICCIVQSRAHSLEEYCAPSSM